MNWLTKLAFMILVRSAHKQGIRSNGAALLRLYGHSSLDGQPVEMWVVVGQENCRDMLELVKGVADKVAP